MTMTSIIKLAGIALISLTCYIFLTVTFSQIANAKVQMQSDVVVCPSWVFDTVPTDLTFSKCDKTDLYNINPTNTLLWVKATVVISKVLLEKAEPLGIFISGKSSSQVYLNGTLIGQNGLPGIDKQSEIPGKMDAVIFAPHYLFEPGENEIILKMSSHGGFLNLASPIHWITLNTYAQPEDKMLRHYWKSFLPLGVLLLGVLYFGLAALRQEVHWLLPLMSLFATGQLFTEVTRGLVAYSYPVHDIRLVLILFFSFSFGLALFAYILNTLQTKWRVYVFFIGAILTSVCIVYVPGFDFKSALSIGLPTVMGLGISVYSLFRKHPRAVEITLSLSIFFVAALLAPARFLDIYFYYIAAALLVLLFIQQLSVLAKETQARAKEKERGDRLQLIIDQNRANQDELTLSINHANKTELVNVSDVAYCKGAGDYVDLTLINGKTLLHSENMAGLEQRLPSIFLRVHRSYIVNTTLITSLERKKSGVGVITLRNGETVPVSRRIMPSVREQF